MSSADAVTLIKKAAEIIENDPEAAPLAPMLRYVADNIAGRRHIMVDLDRNCVVIDGQVIHLRAEGAEIMAILLRPGVRTYDVILRQLYGLREEPSDAQNVLDVNVMHLRRKLADAGFTIKTHWGKGLELLHNGRTTAPSTSKRK